MDLEPKLLKPENTKIELEIWENIFILKNKDRVMNFEILPADILIKQFIPQTPEGRADSQGEGLKMEGNPSETYPDKEQVSDVFGYHVNSLF